MPDDNPTDDAVRPVWTEADRDRGILTQHDREYLLESQELEGQDERNARYRIRQRVFQSLYDMALISEHLDDNDLAKIADDIQEDAEFPQRVLNAPLLLRLAFISAQNESGIVRGLEESVSDAVVDWRSESDLEDKPGMHVIEASTNIDVSDNLIFEEDEMFSVSGEEVESKVNDEEDSRMFVVQSFLSPSEVSDELSKRSSTTDTSE